MERPVNIPQDIYTQIIESAQKYDAHELRARLLEYGYNFDDHITTPSPDSLIEIILSNPTPYLYYELHLLDRAALLENLFLEFKDDEIDEGLTYLIDKEAAEAIAEKKKNIKLKIVYGGGEVSIPRKRLEEAFKNGCTLDYSESKRK